jgi:hypothetical protein
MQRPPGRQIQRRELPELTLTVSDLIPKPTPKNVTIGSLWILGLFFMFLAPALIPASEKAMDLYDEKMIEAQSVDLTAAEERYYTARQRYERSRGWFFQSQSRHNAEAERAMKRSRNELDALLAERAEIQKEGKAAVGLWSEYGLNEVRETFWDSFGSGVGFAKRATKNQAWYSLIFSGMGMRRDEEWGAFILRWIMNILMNFTIGVIGACVSFIWSLWYIIDTYAASWFSSVAFFLVGSIAALSVTFTFVGGIWGTAGGCVYFAAKAAIDQARLQNEQRRRYIEQHGHAPPQQRQYYRRGRSHYD